VETLKPAEDGKGFILRVYEPHGARGRVSIQCDLPVSKVIVCNAAEENAAAVRVKNGRFHFSVRPFQIRTFRLLN